MPDPNWKKSQEEWLESAGFERGEQSWMFDSGTWRRGSITVIIDRDQCTAVAECVVDRPGCIRRDACTAVKVMYDEARKCRHRNDGWRDLFEQLESLMPATEERVIRQRTLR